jgi:hypothetical protein
MSDFISNFLAYYKNPCLLPRYSLKEINIDFKYKILLNNLLKLVIMYSFACL